MEDRTNTNRKDSKDNTQVQDMDEESSDEEVESRKQPNQPAIQPPLPPVPDKVVVKKYDPKQGKRLLIFLFKLL